MSKMRKQFLARLLTFLALALRSAANATGSTFTYEAQNHLTGMSVSGTTVSIVYDAFGNRVSKTVNGVTTKYLVEDDVNPTGYPQVMDEIVSGSVERTYTYGLQRISQEQLISSAWTTSFYGYDGAGTVRQLTNAAGTITDTYDYDAFGNEVNHTGTTPNNYLYRAEQYDSDLGLYYLRARYYNPLTGRFLSRDPENGKPIDPKTLHKYLYADGNPVNAADPTGRAVIEGDEEDDFMVETRNVIAEQKLNAELRYLLCVEGLKALLFTEATSAMDGIPILIRIQSICKAWAGGLN